MPYQLGGVSWPPPLSIILHFRGVSVALKNSSQNLLNLEALCSQKEHIYIRLSGDDVIYKQPPSHSESLRPSDMGSVQNLIGMPSNGYVPKVAV